MPQNEYIITIRGYTSKGVLTKEVDQEASGFDNVIVEKLLRVAGGILLSKRQHFSLQ